MSPADLSTLIDTYGAALEAWPAELHRAARDLLATSDEARAVLGRAQAMEAVLRSPPDGADAVTAERVERLIALTMARVKTDARAVPQAARAVPQAPLAARRSLLDAARDWLSDWGDGWLRYAMPMAVGAVLGVFAGQISADRTGSAQTDSAGLVTLIDAFHNTTGLFGS